ncbi:uncharacterized protein LOC128240600 [Mya arenaria]|uniref:uncharacterized protein LOC128240600 n=1 Tax=Mya arenaria TaxID=6604 RepID=UPI0022E4776D|nr:uncharacterized protein LOC128240600 [Mya arenaria]
MTLNFKTEILLEMMFALIGLLALGAAHGATVSSTSCTNSYMCGQDMCCRATDGHVVSDEPMGGFGPVFMGDGHENGTCSMKKAQKGEVCDSSCKCDTGLACYRPVSGVCCPPMRCYDEAYVQQQHAYWNHCMQDPNCAIPP